MKDILKLLEDIDNGFGDGAGDSHSWGEPDCTGYGSGEADSDGYETFEGFGYGNLQTTSSMPCSRYLGKQENTYTPGCYKWS